MKHRIDMVVAATANFSIAILLCLQSPIAAAAEDGPSTTDSPAASPQAPAQTGETITLRAQAVKKFDAGQKLTSAEYRSLGAGCVGFEAHHTFFEDVATITIVYKDSPAYKAGIRVGDKVIQPEEAEDEKSEEEPNQSREKVNCGLAGSPVDVTLLRDGKPETITLHRMNIEDIQESEYRHNWEKVLRQLGYPREGSFSGTSLNDLAPAAR